MVKGELPVLLTCFFRTYFIGSMYNLKGLQNLGLLYIMEPGLKFFYKDKNELMDAKSRYLSHYNSHPYLMPFLVGYFLFIESKIAKNMLQKDSLNTIKSTTAFTLSALGDSFFGGSLLVLWSFVEILFVLYHQIIWAIIFFLFTFFFLQLFRFFIFWQGYTKGLSFFEVLKNMNLIEWSNRIKYLNAILFLFIWERVVDLCNFLPRPLFFFLGGLTLGVFSYFVYKQKILREIIVIFSMLVIFLLS